MNKKKNIVIFDFDGTLVDSMSAFADLAAHVMPRHYAIDGLTARRLYLESSGRPFREQLEQVFPAHPANATAAEEFEREKQRTYFNEPLFTDAKETIATLRARGFKVVVSSNNVQQLVDQYIARAGIEVDWSLGWRPAFPKGEAHFSAIEKKFGVARAAMTFVGDSLHDGERASAAGVDFVAKAGTFAPTEFRQHFPRAPVIHGLTELPPLFR